MLFFVFQVCGLGFELRVSSSEFCWFRVWGSGFVVLFQLWVEGFGCCGGSGLVSYIIVHYMVSCSILQYRVSGSWSVGVSDLGSGVYLFEVSGSGSGISRALACRMIPTFVTLRFPTLPTHSPRF